MPERLNAVVRGQRFPVFSCTPVDFFPSPGKPRLPPLVPIKDTSRILTKGKHNSPRILVARSLSSRGETREKEKARGGEKRIRREKWERKRERERAVQDNKPGEVGQVRQTREICSHISMARISIATTANCHDYKAKPTTSMVANAVKSNGREGGGAGSTCWPKGLLPAIGLY